MKTTRSFITVIALAALAVGCNKSNPTIEGSPNNATNVSLVSQKLEGAKAVATNAWQQAKATATNAFERTKESVQAATDYAFDKKDAYVVQAGTELDSLDQKIKELSDKAVTASDSVKAEAQTKIRQLNDQRAALNQKLVALQNATVDKWNEAKADFQNAYDATKTSCQQAWQ